MHRMSTQKDNDVTVDPKDGRTPFSFPQAYADQATPNDTSVHYAWYSVTTSTGDSNYHNNIPSSKAIYIWKRKA